MDLKHDAASLAQVGARLVMVVLAMTGIAGTIYKMVAPGGWVAHVFGESFKAGSSLVLAIAMLVGFAYMSRTWTASGNRRNFTSNLVVGLSALAGFVYLSRLWATGTL
jgi:hypothetical protein